VAVGIQALARRRKILPLDSDCIRTYVPSRPQELTDERLNSIERGARERHTLMDRVVLELVEEVRRLRGLLIQRHPSAGSS
jgi:hypothetical protein